jgi:tRNA(Glu) U13 pseudouridine synthase TruD
MINEVIKDLTAVDEVNAAKGIVYTTYQYMPKAIDILESLRSLEVNDYKREAILKAFEDGNRDYVEAFNSYNWNGNVDHHLQWYVVEVNKRKFIILSFHRYGDVRVNYTNEVVLSYDDIDADDFHNAIIDSDQHDTLEVDGVAYNFLVSAINEGVEVFQDGGNSFTIYPDGLTLEDIAKAIKEKEDK